MCGYVVGEGEEIDYLEKNLFYQHHQAPCIVLCSFDPSFTRWLCSLTITFQLFHYNLINIDKH